MGTDYFAYHRRFMWELNLVNCVQFGGSYIIANKYVQYYYNDKNESSLLVTGNCLNLPDMRMRYV